MRSPFATLTALRRHRWLALGMTLGLVLALGGGLAFYLPGRAHAATAVVTTCTESALDAAVAAANPGDTIQFGCSGTITLTSTVNITKDLTLEGSGQSVTLDGGHKVRVLSVTSADFTLDHLTVADGLAAGADSAGVGTGGDGLGGGLYSPSGTKLTLDNCTFSGNTAQGGIGGAGGHGGVGEGGAIYSLGSTLTLDNCTLSNNIAQGGALSFSGSGISPKSGAIFAGSGLGGAIFLSNPQSSGVVGSLTDCNFITNTAEGGSGVIPGEAKGGAIYVFPSSTLDATNCAFLDNTAQGGAVPNGVASSSSVGAAAEGGAIYTFSIANLTDSVVKGNVAQGGYGGNSTAGEGGGSGGSSSGGGILGSGTFTGDTFDSNSARGGKGGTGADVLSGMGGYGGSGGSAFGGAFCCGGNIVVSGSTVSGNSAVGGGGGLGGSGNSAGGTGGNAGEAFGGGFYSDVATAVSASTFTSNSAIGGTGGAGGAGSTLGGTGGVGGQAFAGGLTVPGSVSAPSTFVGSSAAGNSARGGDGGNGGAGGSGGGGTGGTGGRAVGGGLMGSGSSDSMTGPTGTFANCAVTGNAAQGGNGGQGGTASSGPGGDGGSGSPAEGGGIEIVAGSSGATDRPGASVTNCTVADDTARGGNGGAGGASASGVGGNGGSADAGQGGGMYAYLDSPDVAAVLTSVTFGNSAADAGSGGVGGQGGSGTGTSGDNGSGMGQSLYNAFTGLKNTSYIQAFGSILGTGAGDNCAGVVSGILDGGFNLDSGTSCGFSSAHHSLSNTDPKLAALGNYGGPTQTLALLPGSPAINAGGSSANGCPATDQRGVSRPQGSACDIGAYEFVPTTTTTLTASPNPALYQQAVQLCATVHPASGTPGPATGTVSFREGSTTLGSGQLGSSGSACFSTSALSVGDHQVTASYGGDASFTASSSSPLTVTIQVEGQDVAGTASGNGGSNNTSSSGGSSASQTQADAGQNGSSAAAGGQAQRQRAAPHPSSGGAVSGWLQTGLGGLLALLGLAGLGVIFMRTWRRRSMPETPVS